MKVKLVWQTSGLDTFKGSQCCAYKLKTEVYPHKLVQDQNKSSLNPGDAWWQNDMRLNYVQSKAQIIKLRAQIIFFYFLRSPSWLLSYAVCLPTCIFRQEVISRKRNTPTTNIFVKFTTVVTLQSSALVRRHEWLKHFENTRELRCKKWWRRRELGLPLMISILID